MYGLLGNQIGRLRHGTHDMTRIELGWIRDDYRVRRDSCRKQGTQRRVDGQDETTALFAAQFAHISIQRRARRNDDERNVPEAAKKISRIGIVLIFAIAQHILEISAPILKMSQEVRGAVSQTNFETLD